MRAAAPFHVISKDGRCSCGGACGRAAFPASLGNLADWIPGVAIAEGVGSWLSGSASAAASAAAGAAGAEAASGITAGLVGGAKVLGPYLMATAVVIAGTAVAIAIVKGAKR